MKISKKLTKFSLILSAVALVAIPAAFSIMRVTTKTNDADALEIWSIIPSNGPIDGGTELIISGQFDVTATIVQIDGGNNHTLALDDNGKVYAWGNDGYGQLGNDDIYGEGQAAHKSTPVAVDDSGVLAGKTIVQIAAGSHHSLALDSDGKVYAWGEASSGQLGAGSGGHYIQPVPIAVDDSGVLAGKTIVQIAAGGYHSLALDSNGKAYAWGDGWGGQLGDGTGMGYSTPVEVNTSGVLANETIIQVAAGESHSLAVAESGRVYSWGNDGYGQLGNDSAYVGQSVPVAVDTSGVLSNKTITQVAAGSSHSAALDNTGKVYTWGNDGYGQLGNDSDYTNQATPVAVDTSGALSNKTIVQVALGLYHSLALDSSGNIHSWGYNGQYQTWGYSDNSGQLGNNNAQTKQSTPITVDSSSALAGKTMVQIAAGGYHSLALDDDGRVYAWGSDVYGQLGIGTEYFYGNLAHKTTPEATDTNINSSALGYLPDSLAIIFDPAGEAVECLNVNIISANLLTCTSPEHDLGMVDVQVGDGTNSTVLTGGFEYTAANDVNPPNTGAGSLGDSANELQIPSIILACVILFGVTGFIIYRHSKKIRLQK